MRMRPGPDGDARDFPPPLGRLAERGQMLVPTSSPPPPRDAQVPQMRAATPTKTCSPPLASPDTIPWSVRDSSSTSSSGTASSERRRRLKAQSQSASSIRTSVTGNSQESSSTSAGGEGSRGESNSGTPSSLPLLDSQFQGPSGVNTNSVATCALPGTVQRDMAEAPLSHCQAGTDQYNGGARRSQVTATDLAREGSRASEATGTPSQPHLDCYAKPQRVATSGVKEAPVVARRVPSSMCGDGGVSATAGTSAKPGIPVSGDGCPSAGGAESGVHSCRGASSELPSLSLQRSMNAAFSLSPRNSFGPITDFNPSSSSPVLEVVLRSHPSPRVRKPARRVTGSVAGGAVSLASSAGPSAVVAPRNAVRRRSDHVSARKTSNGAANASLSGGADSLSSKQPRCRSNLPFAGSPLDSVVDLAGDQNGGRSDSSGTSASQGTGRTLSTSSGSSSGSGASSVASATTSRTEHCLERRASKMSNRLVEYHCFTLNDAEERRNLLSQCLRFARHFSRRKAVLPTQHGDECQVDQEANSSATTSPLEHLIAGLAALLSYDDCTLSVAELLPELVAAAAATTIDAFPCVSPLIASLALMADEPVLHAVVHSLRRVVSCVKPAVVQQCILPLLMDMRVSFWSAPRAVAAGVFPAVAGVQSAGQLLAAVGLSPEELFRVFSQSCADQDVIVRRTAVEALHLWCKVPGVGVVDTALHLLAGLLNAEAEHDSVKCQLVREVVALAQHVGKDLATEHLQKPYLALCHDRSWRVRFVCGKMLGTFASYVRTADEVAHVFPQLAEGKPANVEPTVCVLGPGEAPEEREVRAVVATQLQALSKAVSLSVFQELCSPTLLRLAEDTDYVVRASAATVLYTLFSLTPPEQFVAATQVLVNLLHDSHPTVQLSAIGSLPNVAAVLHKHIGAVGDSSAVPQIRKGGSAPPRDGDIAVGGANRTVQSMPSPPARLGRRASRMSVKGPVRVPQPSGIVPLARAGSVGPSSSHHNAEMHAASARWRDMLELLVRHMQSISSSGNWRVREAVVGSLCHFSSVMSIGDFVPLEGVIRALLGDPVHSVRASALRALAAVARHYGVNWSLRTALDLLGKEFAPPALHSYSGRVLAARCMGTLVPIVVVVSSPTGQCVPIEAVREEGGTYPPTLPDALKTAAKQEYLRLIQQLYVDKVSNVRLSVVQSIKESCRLGLSKDFLRGGTQFCTPADIHILVEALRKDTDRDVRSAASDLPKLTFSYAEPY